MYYSITARTAYYNMWLHTPRSTICDYKMLLKHVITICNYTHHGQQYVITTCDYDMWLHTPNSIEYDYRHCVLRTQSALIPSKSHGRAHFPPKFNNLNLFFLLWKIRIPYYGKLMVSKWTSSFLPFFFMTLKNSSPVHHYYKCII